MRAVFFDLEGTLLRGTSVSAAMAEWLGRAGELDALERDYAAGRVSNAEIASASAPWFAGVAVADAGEALAGLSRIDGIEDVVRALPFCAIATVTWSWAAKWVACRHRRPPRRPPVRSLTPKTTNWSRFPFI